MRDLERKRRTNRDWYVRHRDRILATPLSAEAREKRRRRSMAWRRARGIESRPPARTRDEQLAQRRAAATAKRRASGIGPPPTAKPKDPAENRARVRAWRRANPEKAREAKRRAQAVRRARKLGAYVERVDPRIVFERDEGICHLCGHAADPEAWHLDHVIPLAKGGEHSYANTAVSHPDCNLRKGVRLGL